MTLYRVNFTKMKCKDAFSLCYFRLHWAKQFLFSATLFSLKALKFYPPPHKKKCINGNFHLQGPVVVKI